MSPCEHCGVSAQEGDGTPWVVNGVTVEGQVATLTEAGDNAARAWGFNLKPHVIVSDETPEQVWSDTLDQPCCTACYK
jgi:hypothetical protein